MTRILIVEDDPAFAKRLDRNLALEGFEITVAEDGDVASERLAGSSFDVVVCDLKMPGLDGLELLRRVRGGGIAGCDPTLPIIILTSVSSVESAVEAMRLGANDYLTKESGRTEVVLRVRRALEQRELANENERLRARLADSEDRVEMVGTSAALDRVKRDIAAAAPTPTTVLITGETGVGKELVARAIHAASGRKGEFIDINSALLPDDTMFQSELFGHERGAFTDARSLKKGKLELASGGTLFLDEIGELPRDTQAKLLRVLETMTFTRLGGTHPLRADVRLVAASNRDLKKEMEEGRFREDLFYRISVFPIDVSPLRTRPEDIVPLARHFLARFAARAGRAAPLMGPAACEALGRYRFPGNVRELRNICERLTIRARGDEITADLLRECGIEASPRLSSVVTIPPDGLSLDDVERDLVVEALRRAEWNQTDAARLLGISVDRINNRVKKYGLTNEKWRVNKSAGEQ